MSTSSSFESDCPYFANHIRTTKSTHPCKMAVEAQSLNYITTLASNPPLYPRNPAEPDRNPLTLYIVRVPGSRDVFLTPLKPREKIVNAQDVISSLYFLHVDDPSDQALATDDDIQETSQTYAAQDAKRLSSASTIIRKPLPTPPASPDEGAFSFVLPPSTSKKHLSVPARKPVVPTRSHLRPPQDRQPSPLPDGRNDAPQGSSSFTGTLLTLIRRDPSTGAQWNVAKIKDPLVEDVSSESLSAQENPRFRTKVAGTPMYIDIDNPGYSKFLNYDQSQPIIDTDGMLTTASLDEADSASRGLFSRRLWMDGSRFADHTYSRSRPTLEAFSAGARSSMHLTSSTAPFVDRRARSYAYKSPWGGKCEFSTGAAGKSLKCRHHIENTASHNETVSDISELRFNLPTKTSSSSIDLGASAKRSSYYGHKHSKSEDYNENDPHWTTIKDEDGHIDYSLGRERAGGGFGGKQAKLGKLIVDNEGQKFLDLVVATNLALWWRAYERTS